MYIKEFGLLKEYLWGSWVGWLLFFKKLLDYYLNSLFDLFEG